MKLSALGLTEKVWIQWKEVQAARDRRISEERTERNFFPGAVITFSVEPNAESFIAGQGYIEGTHPQFKDEEDEKDRPAELTQPLTQEATGLLRGPLRSRLRMIA